MHSPRLGATLVSDGTQFGVWSHHAEQLDLCIYDDDGKTETACVAMLRGPDDVHRAFVKGVGEGTLYGFRAHGKYDRNEGLWFDPSKLLVDPYAKELDRPFVYDSRLGQFGVETAGLVPKARVVADAPVDIKPPIFDLGGLIYEVAVKPFTILHPDVPVALRGTVAALGTPPIIAHLKRLGVSAVELMPIVAWIDERHLPALKLSNGWGYNPVSFMALDPRICPGGIMELRQTVEVLHSEGIGVILDLVFNHTGESDIHGPTLSFRGLDNLAYYRHMPDLRDVLVNDTGCGNTVACDHPVAGGLVVDTLDHFVSQAGVDGFRFDLGTVMGREEGGAFTPDAALFEAIRHHPRLGDRILIAEPWDIGPGGYQLGNFPSEYLEWNDRARDDMRRFWRGDAHMTGALASVLAGSSQIFGRYGSERTRSVSFLAAHDGFTLMDLVSYEHRHNELNGEKNRDGHGENYSWNNGVEGHATGQDVLAARRRDVKALLSTLFATRGAVMLTAGDEGGRSQNGNNNAYCQDNETTWLNWEEMDEEIVLHTAGLSALRQRFSVFSESRFFTGKDGDVTWLNAHGEEMTVAEWESEDNPALTMVLKTWDRVADKQVFLAIMFNRGRKPLEFSLPQMADAWSSSENEPLNEFETVPARSVFLAVSA